MNSHGIIYSTVGFVMELSRVTLATHRFVYVCHGYRPATCVFHDWLHNLRVLPGRFFTRHTLLFLFPLSLYFVFPQWRVRSPAASACSLFFFFHRNTVAIPALICFPSSPALRSVRNNHPQYSRHCNVKTIKKSGACRHLEQCKRLLPNCHPSNLLSPSARRERKKRQRNKVSMWNLR